MKKLLVIAVVSLITGLGSCGNPGTPAAPKDSVQSKPSNSLDSAANNGVLPPSAAPGNADNSSLADTTYKAKQKDSLKH